MTPISACATCSLMRSPYGASAAGVHGGRRQAAEVLAFEGDLLFSLLPDEPEDFVSEEDDLESEEEPDDEEESEDEEDEEDDEPSPLPFFAAGVLLDEELRLSLR
ncbi:hypothetical protein GCM10009801_02450 [Streptomyces albiaxialis]|uniref:Uncharacterized protein n=1 Tax=Streptomyces albiaxialis TaxID=329523 RepID=A0ABN2VF90_9ACTN